MENFNEEEIQRKIEEKRKRFIENAHRALGFYDHNILSSPDDNKKKRAETIEKEFNKVFDEPGSSIRRYDDEPAKPLILAASKNPENVNSSPSGESKNIEQMESKPSFVKQRTTEPEEDSLTVHEKEMGVKNQASLSTNDATRQESNNSISPVLEARNSGSSSQEEDKKESPPREENIPRSKKRTKEKAKMIKNRHEFTDEPQEDNYYVQNKQYKQNMALATQTKKAKKFVVNTRHCRQERETLQYVIDLCRWYETTSMGDGNLIWYGVSLRD